MKTRPCRPCNGRGSNSVVAEVMDFGDGESGPILIERYELVTCFFCRGKRRVKIKK